MEIVLYDKEYGYYCNELPGPYRDYITSPQVHNIFGELTGKKIMTMWETMNKPGVFTIVEIGPGDGILCRQILKWSKEKCPEFYESINYIILFINKIDIEKLKQISPKVSLIMYGGVNMPLRNIKGCFLSNELLDAFPVNLVTSKNGELKEIFLTTNNGEIKEVEDGLSTGEIEEYFKIIDTVLPDGNRGEVNLGAVKWLREVGGALKEGYILTVDYGYYGKDMFSHKRKEGTLLCFYQHSFNSNPYRRLGYQDITTHVDFTALIKYGEEEGLILEEYSTQRDFLIELGIEREVEKLDKNNMNLMGYNHQLKAFRRLIDSRGLGKIKVLIQSRF